MPTLLALDRVLTRPLTQWLGRYQLLGRLGAGGMAEVFVARCGELAGMQSLVAIKRILPHLAEDEAFIALFRREAQISLRLRHRAIARVVEVGCAASAWFLAMELVPGESLAHLLRAEREHGIVADPRVVAWVGAEIASALHHAHTLTDGGAVLPVIHRDVSPQNILLGFDGAAKLIDFGVARCAHLSDATRTGTVRGKLAYASPEQLGARPLDGRSDLFSLAVVLHEWLAGTPLFACDNDAATVQAVQAAEIPPLPRAPRLGAVLARALARDPAQRFPDGEAFADALLTAAGDRRPSVPERLVADHVRALFPDRAIRWQAIIAGRPFETALASDQTGGARGTVASALALTVGAGSVVQSVSLSVSASAPVTPGSATRARYRRRRRMAVALAAAVGFASLVVGLARRDSTSTSVSTAASALASVAARAVPVVSTTPVATTAVAPATPPVADAPRVVVARDRASTAPRRRVHHASAPAARRAIVDELEPSPYVRR